MPDAMPRIMGRWTPEATDIKRKMHHRAKGRKARTILRLPDLEHAKTAVLNSLMVGKAGHVRTVLFPIGSLRNCGTG
jgi:hypothetical protein